VTKSDFIDWKRHPVTQEVFSQLRSRVDELKDRLVGKAAASAPEATHLAGIIEGFQFLLNIDYEDDDNAY
jgi:hypothetical protein